MEGKYMFDIFKEITMAVVYYLKADWYILLIGILLAVAINVYVDTNKLKRFLERKAGLSIPGSVAFGAFTPLCACGTMAVLISMFVSAMPWGPVMAFLVSSPLTSPSEFMFETAFFGSKFAIAMVVSSVILGTSAGFIAHLLEVKTNFFKSQFRMEKSNQSTCCGETVEEQGSCCDEIKQSTSSCCEQKPKKIVSCCGENELASQSSCCSSAKTETVLYCSKEEIASTNDNCCGSECFESDKKTLIQRYKLDKFVKEFVNIGLKKVLLYFVIFIAIGRVVEMIIPKEWIMSLFGNNSSYSIPLAATVGLPLYLNDSSALPLLKSFMNSGAGQGAVLAFLIAGKATGAPVIAGMATFLRKRAMLFYVGFIYVGAIIAGYLFQLFIK
jgi:uncharacterized protein